MAPNPMLARRLNYRAGILYGGSMLFPRAVFASNGLHEMRERRMEVAYHLRDRRGGGVPPPIRPPLPAPVECGLNPSLDPVVDRAYYPTILYFPAGRTVGGSSYRYLCIHALDMDAGGGLILAGSNDFMAWAQLNGADPLPGLSPASHHPRVVQLGADLFRLYYWDSAASIYGPSSVRTALSSDLVNWTGDTALLNGASAWATGAGAGWNRGSYGPGHIIYNPAAANAGANPFAYTYAMYFGATDGSRETVGLAYGADGVTFELYGEVLGNGAPGSWDSSYTTYPAIVRSPAGGWALFYSGGATAAHEGLGAATSEDGLAWTRLSVSAPYIARAPGTWREDRCYAAGAVADFAGQFSGAGRASECKLLVSGRSGAGDYACGSFCVDFPDRGTPIAGGDMQS